MRGGGICIWENYSDTKGWTGEGGYEEEGFVDDIGAGVEGDYSKGRFHQSGFNISYHIRFYKSIMVQL